MSTWANVARPNSAASSATAFCVGPIQVPPRSATCPPGKRVVEGAAADAVACLEHDDPAAGRGQRPGGGQSGEPGPHDDDVRGQ